MEKNGGARLTVNDKAADLAVVEGTEHEHALDIAALRAETGCVTLDEGFANTAACRSAVTFIDGDQGILRYRGYPIEELAERSSFLEVASLLIYGELPAKAALDKFKSAIAHHSLLHEDLKNLYGALPRDAHPMAILSSVVSALSTFYQDAEDPANPEHVELMTFRLLGKLPTIAAYAYKKSMGQPFIYPRNDLSYAENFLRMMFAVPAEDCRVHPVHAKALDLLFILHADHEQNCSTSTVRLVGSSGTNLFASISAGIAALWGPLHGGANQAVIEMLEGIRKSGDSPARYVERVKKKESGIKLMGFGHRVYKNFDPRATIIKRACDEVLTGLGISDPLLGLAKEMEGIALRDQYFVDRKLYPNVDFYSGILYRALGFPVTMFTALFALGRLPGWIAHWREQQRAGTRIGRPRQVYVGATKRAYLALDKRG